MAEPRLTTQLVVLGNGSLNTWGGFKRPPTPLAGERFVDAEFDLFDLESLLV